MFTPSYQALICFNDAWSGECPSRKNPGSIFSCAGSHALQWLLNLENAQVTEPQTHVSLPRSHWLYGIIISRALHSTLPWQLRSMCVLVLQLDYCQYRSRSISLLQSLLFCPFPSNMLLSVCTSPLHWLFIVLKMISSAAWWRCMVEKARKRLLLRCHQPRQTGAFILPGSTPVFYILMTDSWSPSQVFLNSPLPFLDSSDAEQEEQKPIYKALPFLPGLQFDNKQGTTSLWTCCPR